MTMVGVGEATDFMLLVEAETFEPIACESWVHSSRKPHEADWRFILPCKHGIFICNDRRMEMIARDKERTTGYWRCHECPRDCIRFDEFEWLPVTP